MRDVLKEFFQGRLSTDETVSHICRLTHEEDPNWRNNALILIITLKKIKSQLYHLLSLSELNSNSQENTLSSLYSSLISALKITFQTSPDISWKDGLFHRKSISRLNLHNVGITSNFHLSYSISQENFVQHDNPILGVSSVIGITYCHQQDEDSAQTKLCLDAEYTSGSAGTTADGIGEYHDDEMNKNIAKSSTITAKYLTRLVNGYHSSGQLFKEMPQLFQHVQTIIKAHFHPNPIEGACCVVTKAFLEKDGSVSVVTSSVGDCMAIAWDKKNKSVTVLASARHHDFGMQFNPISITDNLSGSAMQTTVHNFKNPIVIIRMTDGAWQPLPNNQSIIKNDRKTKKRYLEPAININTWNTMLTEFDAKNPHASATDYRDFLLSKIISNLNETKKQLHGFVDFLKSSYLNKFMDQTNKTLDSATFKEFYTWLKNIDIKFHAQLSQLLTQQEYVMDLIKDACLAEIISSLENNIELGDDVTLTVHDPQAIYDFCEFKL